MTLANLRIQLEQFNKNASDESLNSDTRKYAKFNSGIIKLRIINKEGKLKAQNNTTDKSNVKKR